MVRTVFSIFVSHAIEYSSSLTLCPNSTDTAQVKKLLDCLIQRIVRQIFLRASLRTENVNGAGLKLPHSFTLHATQLTANHVKRGTGASEDSKIFRDRSKFSV